MGDAKIIKLDRIRDIGEQLHIGLCVDDVAPGNLWASKAAELGEQLLNYHDMKVEVVNSTKYDPVNRCAEYDFFARYDTAYILAYNGIPVTIQQIVMNR